MAELCEPIDKQIMMCDNKNDILMLGCAMLEKVKNLWAQWKVQISVVGGALVVATAYGSCTFEAPAVEEPAACICTFTLG